MNAMQLEQMPARVVAGALAYLARHMETGCPRAGQLAVLLLDKLASNPGADADLRAHARELVDILERNAFAHLQSIVRPTKHSVR